MKRNVKINHENSEPSIEKLTVQLDFKPVDAALFVKALTHSSYANEHNLPSNERLEFLGDSVLGLIVCDFLFKAYPDYDEGELAKLKGIIVSAPLLASFSQSLRLNEFVRLGRGEKKTSGNMKLNILADLFEAFIGAYFLNFGLDATAKFVLPLVRQKLPEIIEQFDGLNAKNNLQEYLQAIGKKPIYRTIKEEGPPHERWFFVETLVAEKVVGTGMGRSIKEAQSQAARMALENLKHDEG